MPRSHTAKLTVIISAGLSFFFRFEDIKITYPFPRVERIPAIMENRITFQLESSSKPAILHLPGEIPWHFQPELVVPRAGHFNLKCDPLIVTLQLTDLDCRHIPPTANAVFPSAGGHCFHQLSLHRHRLNAHSRTPESPCPDQHNSHSKVYTATRMKFSSL